MRSGARCASGSLPLEKGESPESCGVNVIQERPPGNDCGELHALCRRNRLSVQPDNKESVYRIRRQGLNMAGPGSRPQRLSERRTGLARCGMQSCKTRASIPLADIHRLLDTPIWKLEAAL